MSQTETYLLLVAVVLFAALVIVVALGRLDSRDADNLAKAKTELELKVRHLQERNAELRDELDAAITGAPSLTEAIYADLASLPITHPGDPR